MVRCCFTGPEERRNATGVRYKKNKINPPKSKPPKAFKLFFSNLAFRRLDFWHFSLHRCARKSMVWEQSHSLQKIIAFTPQEKYTINPYKSVIKTPTSLPSVGFTSGIRCRFAEPEIRRSDNCMPHKRWLYKEKQKINHTRAHSDFFQPRFPWVRLFGIGRRLTGPESRQSWRGRDVVRRTVLWWMTREAAAKSRLLPWP